MILGGMKMAKKEAPKIAEKNNAMAILRDHQNILALVTDRLEQDRIEWDRRFAIVGGQSANNDDRLDEIEAWIARGAWGRMWDRIRGVFHANS